MPRKYRPRGLTARQVIDQGATTRQAPPPDVDGDCLVWNDTNSRTGYGQVWWQGTTVLAHRLAYFGEHGVMPPAVDHRCFVRACVTRSHLREATSKQNNEHLQGARITSRTGVRGVYPDPKVPGQFIGQVRHYGRRIVVGYFTDLDAADQAVRAKRAELFTHVGSA